MRVHIIQSPENYIEITVSRDESRVFDPRGGTRGDQQARAGSPT